MRAPGVAARGADAEGRCMTTPAPESIRGKASSSSHHRRACSSAAEHGAHNPRVAGSNPAGPTMTSWTGKAAASVSDAPLSPGEHTSTLR